MVNLLREFQKRPFLLLKTQYSFMTYDCSTFSETNGNLLDIRFTIPAQERSVRGVW